MSDKELAATLREKTEFLAPHFKPGFLQTEQAVFQFQFDEAKPFHLDVQSSSFTLSPGLHSSPTITLYIDQPKTCWSLLIGCEDGMQAFMDGRYRADGNIVLSQLLLYMFKSDDPTIVYEVQD
ncbi:SCP2 sterol-binding domain-containing protein [Pseudomonadales bacterium]|nr:SCP2 sterol-binding domain-containing protein [Pseudomonadales bacterium]